MKVALPSSPFNRADLFEAAGFEVVEGRVRSTEDFVELMKDADGAQVGVMPLTTRAVMEACPKLKVVSRLGVGVDSIDLDAATELGVLACNVPGVNTTEVADHAVAMLLSVTRCLHDAIASTRQGQWRENPRTTGNYVNSVRRIAGHVVGIVGFGNIGRAFATRIRGFGPAEVIAYDPYVEQTAGDLYGVRMVDFEEILERSDYITIHCSATTSTGLFFPRKKPTHRPITRHTIKGNDFIYQLTLPSQPATEQRLCYPASYTVRSQCKQPIQDF